VTLAGKTLKARLKSQQQETMFLHGQVCAQAAMFLVSVPKSHGTGSEANKEISIECYVTALQTGVSTIRNW